MPASTFTILGVPRALTAFASTLARLSVTAKLPIIAALLGPLPAAVLVACGGGSKESTAPPPVQPSASVASLTVSSGNSQSAAAGATLPTAVVVRALAQGGTPVSGVSLTGSVSAGSLASSSVTTSADGTASFAWTLGSTPGTQTLSVTAASAPSVTAATVSATATSGPSAPRLTTLVPGGSATFVGPRLTGATSVTVDGQTVAMSNVTDTSVSFTLPAAPACDVDGRVVSVTVAAPAGTQSATGTVSLAASAMTSLRPGESRVLTGAIACMALPRDATAHYMLTAVNFGRAAQIDTLFTLKAMGVATAVGAASHSMSTVARFGPSASFATRASLTASNNSGEMKALRQTEQFMRAARNRASSRTGALRASAAPMVNRTGNVPASGLRPSKTVYGPTANISNVAVGDTVTLYDWYANVSPVPQYRAIVAAVHGSHVILVDSRLSNTSTILAQSAKLDRVATLVDQYMAPALHAVFGSDTQVFLPGQGGKTYSIFTTLNGIVATTNGGDQLPTSVEPRSLYANVIIMTANFYQSDVGSIVSTICHENGHIVDLGSYYAAGRSAPGAQSEWVIEALASAVQEVAARMSMNTPTGATLPSTIGTSNEIVLPQWETLGGGWRVGNSFNTPIWGPLGTNTDAGKYTIGSQILTYVREKMGQADYRTPTPKASTMWYRLFTGSTRTIDDVGALIGLTGNQLLAQSELAVATNGLVAQADAQRETLPAFTSWNNVPTSMDAFYRGLGNPFQMHQLLPRSGTVSEDAGVAGGSYDFWVTAPDANKGISYTITPKAGASYELRLTRLQ